MKRTRHTPEQVIRKLRDADRMLAEQKSIAEIAKELGVSKNTYHRWRNRFGGNTYLQALYQRLRPRTGHGVPVRIVSPAAISSADG